MLRANLSELFVAQKREGLAGVPKDDFSLSEPNPDPALAITEGCGSRHPILSEEQDARSDQQNYEKSKHEASGKMGMPLSMHYGVRDGYAVFEILKSFHDEQSQKQIPSLRCGMINKKDHINSKAPDFSGALLLARAEALRFVRGMRGLKLTPTPVVLCRCGVPCFCAKLLPPPRSA
jgi:hypothetical protein